MSGRSVISVGGLLPSDLLDRVAAVDPTLPGTSAESYGLVPGERLNDAITRSWNRLTGVWSAFSSALAETPESDRTATTLTRDRWLRPLLDELGFAQLPASTAQTIDEKDYPISHQWAASVPVHQLGALVPVDRRSPNVPGAARTSPHGLVQEFLNRSDQHLWAVLTNGRVLRILRDNASLTRQAYVEFDLEVMFEGEQFADFVLLWLLAHRTRFDASIPENCWLELWTNEAAATGTRALDRLRDGVEAAIAYLGSGFVAHPNNRQLRESLSSGALTVDDYQRQLLRIAYRLLFLLVAESRNLLLDPSAPDQARDNYERFYSMARLQRLAETRRGGAHDDLWESHELVVNALASEGQAALGIAPLGSFLWSRDSTPNLAGVRISNRHVLDAMRALTVTRDGDGIDRRVDYRNLGAEELGSVYESLLELNASVDVAAGTVELNHAAGNDRKTSGSYYTPTPLINELLDSALEPVLREAARSTEPEASILGLSVVDPACGSGHFLIAAANRIAHRLAMVRAEGVEPAPDQVRTALRDVVGSCIHGIDVNPMAVELCKISLWLEAMEPGRPLGFLDHRIVCGNSLLGVTPRLLDAGVPQDAFAALTGDDKALVSSLKKRNKAELAGQDAFDFGSASVSTQASAWAEVIDEIDQIDADAVEGVREKQRVWEAFATSDDAQRSRRAADAWCAAIVGPKVDEAKAVTTQTVRKAADGTLGEELAAHIDQIARHYGFLHLHLAFPEQFSISPNFDTVDDGPGWVGGFDVVLGNPPWERVKLQEKEWFATRDPAIAGAGNKAERQKLIDALATEHPAMHEAFGQAQRRAEGESHFLLKSGAYPLCGRGDVNTYSVFAETMRQMVSSTGRVGVIVPTGIATDDTTKYFFQSLVEHRSLVSLFDFENRRRPIDGKSSSSKWFDGVDSRVKFCLLSLSGPARPIDEADFVFFGDDISELSDPERRFTLTPEDFELLNPNTRTCPIFRTRRDAEITKGIYRRVPVLIKEGRDGQPDENPWGVKFDRMFDMSNDSHLFRTRDQLEDEGWQLQGNIFTKGDDRYLPLIEAKMLGFLDNRAADVVRSKTAQKRQAQPRQISDAEKANPSRLAIPLYWVPKAEVDRALGENRTECLLGFRNVTSPTNERTMIPTVLPNVGVGHSEPVIVGLPTDLAMLLSAVLASYCFDFIARQKVGGVNFTYGYLSQIPVPAPVDFDGALRERLIAIARDLAATSWDTAHLSPNRLPVRYSPERRQSLMDELNALVFIAYGVERSDIERCMGHFPIVQRSDEAEFGVYRTLGAILDQHSSILAEGVSSSGSDFLSEDRPDWADVYLEMAQ